MSKFINEFRKAIVDQHKHTQGWYCTRCFALGSTEFNPSANTGEPAERLARFCREHHESISPECHDANGGWLVAPITMANAVVEI